VTVTHVESADDPRVAVYARLTDRDLLLAHGVFVAEGRLVVRRVLDDGRYTVRSLLLNEAAHRALAPHLARLPPATPVYVGANHLFDALSGHHIHRGCLALVERAAPSDAGTILDTARLVVVLEHVTDADNVGGVFRNAAALGADAVLLSPATCDPLYRKAVRTSMAAVLTVPYARLDPWPAQLARLRDRGFTLVALTPQEPADPLDAVAARLSDQRVAIIAGTEGSGLSDEAVRYADVRARIPMRAGVDSLNLSVAVGVALSRLGRL
jgi:tRNA G18 (ribose-2'-O)-methylase SpoU